MKEKDWKYAKINTADVEKITSREGYTPIQAKLIVARGLIDSLERERFLKTSSSQFHDPYLMKDMANAVDLIIDCYKSGKKILILGDYDVDGTTGTSLLYTFFAENLEMDVSFYIPNREREGYGLPFSGIDHAVQIGASLLITCDFGINAFEQITYAHDYGLDVIISDHHLPQESLPDAEAVLNPKRLDCPYPFKDLCGAGVAFKLVQAVAYRLDVPEEKTLQLLEFACLGTAADIVPIVGENRIIMALGLDRLRETQRPGLLGLLDIAGIDISKSINVSQLVFRIAPRINALGRMGEGYRAVELLTTKDRCEVAPMAQIVDIENQNRRVVEKAIVDEAIQQIRFEYDLETARGLVLWGDQWHLGVIGIVASKIKEEFYLPTIVISFQNGEGKGSGRSIEGLDLYQLLDLCSNHLTNHGGHKMAAGLSITKEQLPAFRDQISALFHKMVSPEMLVPKLYLDLNISLDNISYDLLKFLDKMAPFGPGNMRPIFSSTDVKILYPKVVGSGKHLKFCASQNGYTFDAIAFNQSEDYQKFFNKEPVHIAYVIEINEWNGRKNIQLNIHEIKTGESPNQ